MSWISRLEETYESCVGQPHFRDDPLLPVNHSEQQAHIEITIGEIGDFRHAVVVAKERTPIPTTEASAGRTSGLVPHALSDKLSYLAPRDGLSPRSDSTDAAAGAGYCASPNRGHEAYIHQLRGWVATEPDPHLGAVLNYVGGGTILEDLAKAGILHAHPTGRLLTAWQDTDTIPPLFKVLPATGGHCDQLRALVRWRVELTEPRGDARLWCNRDVQQSWQRYCASKETESELCMASGQMRPRAANHPKRIRHAADNAKLISAMDNSGYTYHGRFENAEQACSVGLATTQKAHNALRWLIARQGFRVGNQAIVAWAVNGAPLPSITSNSAEAGVDDLLEAGADRLQSRSDVGKPVATSLKALLWGRGTQLADYDDVVVLALDSAVPGRVAITYYRELKGSEFLERVLGWHERMAWVQDMGKGRKFIGAPSLDEITKVAFGRRLDERLKAATIERLLSSIIDGRTVPPDIVTACVNQACNRAGKGSWEWERCLAVACSLVRSSRSKENYSMSLELERHSRSYLFGRLLAVAERIENYSLWLGKENRSTSAERLMRHFSEKPVETWRSIELALQPYLRRVQTRRPLAYFHLTSLLDEIIARFEVDDFIRSGPLDSEFLLGYHCQRAALRHRETADKSENAEPAA